MYRRRPSCFVVEYIISIMANKHNTIGSKELHALRSQTIERIFADAKGLHGIRYAKHRGLDRVKMELNLLFGYMNLKKLANRLWKNGNPFAFLLVCVNIRSFSKKFANLKLLVDFCKPRSNKSTI